MFKHNLESFSTFIFRKHPSIRVHVDTLYEPHGPE